MMELDMAAKEARNYSGTTDDAKHCNKDAGVLYKQHLGVGPGPLGLHLTKSASLVNMIQMVLHDQASKEKGRNTRSNGYCGVLNRTSMTKAIPCSKFCASYLRIGTWELSQVPIFFKETDTQPGMSTKWQRTLDFTDGQASLHRYLR
ncbi:hypothetical protein PR202_ga27792 [Eleusine coracana subsp. coracana]|uniref:TRF2/HOY1 PH-like domain-containing protein n=1 Tax=Eleusine coracana subsp. coracana TaxID=191504 RepID=A0AAV5DG44_ELECO|nr:hypothetical protein PR202_ga27792 [Eleusine coracana subsp. coracana]